MSVYAQKSFAAGELSPNMYGRTDVQPRVNGVKTALNTFVKSTGVMTRRPGTDYSFDFGSLLGSGSSKDTDTYLGFSFSPSTDETYQIVMFEDRLVVFQDGATIDGGSAEITVISANQITLDSAWHSNENENVWGPVQFTTTGTLPSPLVAGQDYWLGRSILASPYRYFVWDDPDIETATALVLSGGSGTHTMHRSVVSWFIEVDAAEVEYCSFAQKQKAVYFRAAGDRDAFKISLSESGEWRLDVSDDTFTQWEGIEWVNGPWNTANPDDILLEVTGLSTGDIGDSGTLTAESLNSGTLTDFFVAGDVGSYIRFPILDPSINDVGVLKITGFTNSTTVSVDVERAFPGSADYESVDFNFGLAWTDTNQPTKVSFAEGRLWQAGEPERKDIVSASKLQQYENYSPTDDDGTVQVTSAIDIAIDTQESPNVQWLIGALRSILVGTDQGVLAIKNPANQFGAASAGGISSLNVEATPAIGEKVGKAIPRLVGSTLFCTSLSDQRLYGIEYQFTSDEFKSDDLSIFAEHIASTGIRQIALVQDPERLIYLRLADGTVAAVAFNRSQELLGWTRVETDGLVKTIFSGPGATNDELWMVVQREIDGSTVNFLEKLKAVFNEKSAVNDGVFLDCCAFLSGNGGSQPILATHLVGETVRVFSGGSDLGSGVVDANGRVPDGQGGFLGSFKSDITAGLPFNSDIALLPPVGQNRSGDIDFEPKAIGESLFRFTRTGSASVGTTFDDLDPIDFRGDTPTNQPIPLFTGTKRQVVPGTWDVDSAPVVRTSDSLPMTLVAVSYRYSDGGKG